MTDIQRCGCTADSNLPDVCPVCRHREHGASGCRAAASPSSDTRPELDVERLARALFERQESLPGGADRDWSELNPDIQTAWLRDAEKLAHEYAALASPPEPAKEPGS